MMDIDRYDRIHYYDCQSDTGLGNLVGSCLWQRNISFLRSCFHKLSLNIIGKVEAAGKFEHRME